MTTALLRIWMKLLKMQGIQTPSTDKKALRARDPIRLTLNRRLNLRLHYEMHWAFGLTCTCELRPAANGIYVNKYFTGENDEPKRVEFKDGETTTDTQPKKLQPNRGEETGWKGCPLQHNMFRGRLFSLKFNAYYEYTNSRQFLPCAAILFNFYYDFCCQFSAFFLCAAPLRCGALQHFVELL